jgi:hypothetical protein
VSVPHGGWDALRQGLLMLACYGAYALSRMMVAGREAVAHANGLFSMGLEKTIGIYVEPWIQGRVSSVHPVMTAFVYLYQDTHLPVIIATLVFAFTRRRDYWPLVRNWFLAMNFMAVVVFALVPTMPPRMLSTSGIADIDFLYGVRSHIMEDGPLANPFAAMPSLHFGYALFIALVIAMLVRRRWVCWAAFSYPVLIWVAVISTGNHLILDTAGGALVTFVAYVFAANLQPVEVPDPTAAAREGGG